MGARNRERVCVCVCEREREREGDFHTLLYFLFCLQDIAVLSDNMTQCTKLLQESFNVMPRGSCKETYTGTNVYREWSVYNNQDECEREGGESLWGC